ARRHVPVQRPGRTVGFLDPIAVGVVGVGVTSCAGDTVLLIIAVVLAASIVGHVAGCVVLEIGTGLYMQTVLHVGGAIHALRIALRQCDAGQIALGHQVAPGVVGVAVAPKFGLAVDCVLAAVGSCVLGGDQPVQGVVSEGLVSAVIAVV